MTNDAREMMELKPCPFCGRKVVLSVLEDDPGEIISAWVTCTCGVEMHELPTETAAAERWNNRTASERLAAGTGEREAPDEDQLPRYPSAQGSEWAAAALSYISDIPQAEDRRYYMALYFTVALALPPQEPAQPVAASSTPHEAPNDD